MENKKKRRFWVGRESAATYLAIVAVTFGISVLGTRAYLALSGYPQIGGTTYHIAHAIWGGLALFIAGVMVLLYSNRSVLTAAAVLTGVGSGLFIDEIGKFITKANDYFFPLAATLIYIFGMALVGLMLWKQRKGSIDDATAAMRALEIASGLTSSTIRPEELAHLAKYSEQLESSDDPAHAALSRYTKELVIGSATDEELARKVKRSSSSQVVDRVAAFDEKHISRRPYRFLIILMTIAEAIALLGYLLLVPLLLIDAKEIVSQVDLSILNDGALDSGSERIVYLVQLVVQILVQFVFVASLVNWWRKREGRAVKQGLFAIVVQLAVVNTVAGYFDMEKLVFRLFLDIPLLLLLLRYKGRFIDREEEQSAPEAELEPALPDQA